MRIQASKRDAFVCRHSITMLWSHCAHFRRVERSPLGVPQPLDGPPQRRRVWRLWRLPAVSAAAEVSQMPGVAACQRFLNTA